MLGDGSVRVWHHLRGPILARKSLKSVVVAGARRFVRESRCGCGARALLSAKVAVAAVRPCFFRRQSLSLRCDRVSVGETRCHHVAAVHACLCQRKSLWLRCARVFVGENRCGCHASFRSSSKVVVAAVRACSQCKRKKSEDQCCLEFPPRVNLG